MFIWCRYTVSWLHMLKTQEKAVCFCCLMHAFMQRSKEKQLEANVFAFGWGEQWWNYFLVTLHRLTDDENLEISWTILGWTMSGNSVLKRDQFEVGVCVFFLLLMDLKDALGQLAAFSVRHLVLLFIPFLLLAQGGICIFFCWCTFNTKPRYTNREEAGSI